MVYIQREYGDSNFSVISTQNDEFMITETRQTEANPMLDTELTADAWKIMIVDDEAEVHKLTKLALHKLTFEGKPLAFLSAYSGAEAEALIQQHPDTAVILLDVVMETIDSGLHLIRFIREELGNKLVRIVLRTGQPGEAPEEAIIRDYDINDYKTKTELVGQKLYTTVIISLRTFTSLTALQIKQAELEKLSQSLSERNQELQKAKEIAETANRSKTEFLSTMSHELRTPLSVILMQSEIMQTGVYGPLTPKQENSVELIRKSGQHLLELINDILDLSRIEAGKFELDLGPTSVNMVCEFSLHAVEAMAANKKIEIQFAIDEKIPMLNTDERRLVQILVNLLKNAIKFTPSGSAVGLRVSNFPEQKMLTFTVWDTGIGIAPEDIGRLFQPFVQLDSGLTRKYEGSGLGLSIVARVLNLLGGDIKIESKTGQGSHFIITLPWNSAKV